MMKQQRSLLCVLSAVILVALGIECFVPPINAAPSLVWKKRFGFASTSTPFLDTTKNWLYINGGNDVCIVNPQSGAVIKNTSIPRGFLSDGGSDVVKAGSRIYFAANATVFCTDADTLGVIWEFGAMSYFGRTPLYSAVDDSLYVTNDVAVTMYKFNATTGKVIWSAALLGGLSINSNHLAFSKKHDLVFTSTNAALVAVKGANGTVAWSWEGQSENCAVLSDDEDIVFFADTYGFVRAFDTATGKLKWQVAVEVEELPLVYDKGVLYFSSYAYDATSGKQLWQISGVPDAAGDTSRVYGDVVITTSDNGIYAVARNGSGVAWKWNGTESFVGGFSAPTPQGELFLSDQHGYVYKMQIPPASGNTGKGIVEKACSDSNCLTGCATRHYVPAGCVQTGPTSSLTRRCFGSRLLVKAFAKSTTCDPDSFQTDYEYAVGKCYTQPYGGSFEVVSCSA